MTHVEEWRQSDIDLSLQYTRNYNKFRALMRNHLSWHAKILSQETGKENAVWNEYFEKPMGIIVSERTIFDYKD